MQPMQSPAAWHPDPTGRYEYRYFNGDRWTSDVSVGGRHYVDVDGLAPQGVTGKMAAKGPAIRGFALAAFWVSLGSLLTGWLPFVFVVAAGGAITATVFAIIALRRSSRSDTDRTRHGRGLAIAALVLSPLALGMSVVGFFVTREVLREFERFVEPGPHQVEIDSCTTTDGLTTMSGTITNLSDSTRDYVVNVRYQVFGLDSASDIARIDDVPAGKSATFETTEFVDVGITSGTDGAQVFIPVTCRIESVTGRNPFGID